MVFGRSPHQVAFQSTSAGNITSWLWDWGDGTTGAGETAAHTYLYPGKYSVRLTVSGPNGSDSLIRRDLVHVDGEHLFLPLLRR